MQQLIHYATLAFASVGGIVTAASSIAPLFPRDSTIGQWIAWVASCPIGHHPKKDQSNDAA